MTSLMDDPTQPLPLHRDSRLEELSAVFSGDTDELSKYTKSLLMQARVT